jgi:mono/diheme cytochrome c family protein
MRLPRHPAARLAVLGLTGLIVIQLLPVWLLQTNPPVSAEPAWDSPETRALAQRACFDCHSNETVWPWYSKVAPASWLVTRDVLSGRSRLNFSEWAVHAGHEHGEDAGEAVTSGEMPPALYVVMHPAADLTPAERQLLAAGLQHTFGGEDE